MVPFVVYQQMNRRTFDIRVQTQLAPTLPKGDAVILDSLPDATRAQLPAIA
jgi:hypothetical protein